MSDPFKHAHPSFLEIEEWTKLDSTIIAGFTTRMNGNSISHYESLNMGLHVNDNPIDVVKNRELLANAIGLPLGNWVCGEQVHDTVICKITSEHRGSGSTNMESALLGVDGIYTREDGILLTAFFADCVPIFYHSPVHHLIGIAHAGWKGTVGGIAPKMIEKWIDAEDVNPKDIYVTIGPAICKDCYEVDRRIIEQVDNVLPNQMAPYIRTSEFHYKLDLQQMNKQLLIDSGVLEKNIQTTNYCTSCSSHLFYSHRKEKGKTGRMLGFIGRKET